MQNIAVSVRSGSGPCGLRSLGSEDGGKET